MSDEAAEQAGRQSHLHDDLMTEYYRIADIVAGFDQRLLTVKSWGVTFALATWLSASSRTTTDSSWLPRRARSRSG